MGKNAIKVENRKLICNFYSLSYCNFLSKFFENFKKFFTRSYVTFILFHMDRYGKKRVEFLTLSASVFWLALLALLVCLLREVPSRDMRNVSGGQSSPPR
jgi:hypothetical protein